MGRKWLLFLLILSIVALPVLGQGDWNGFDVSNVDLTFADLSVKAIWIGAGIIALLTVYSLVNEKKLKKKQKKWLFWGIVIPAVLISLFIAGSTIFVNVLSVSKGPVHWHTDFEIYKCGENLDLINPTGFSNRVGTPKFHEHGEFRIHIEGKIVRVPEVNFQSFFRVIGGSLDANGFSFPTDKGDVSVKNGELCNGSPGELQAFLYEIVNPDPTKKTGLVYEQRKLVNFLEYVPAPFFNVPPSDCLILEFGAPKERTSNICETYKIAIEKGDLAGN